MARLLIIMVVLAINISAILAGTIDPKVSDKKYLDFGEKFEHTVVVMGKSRDGNPYIASGTLIKPDYVLTAAHVIHNAASCLVIFDDKTGTIVSEIICHKDFDLDKVGKCDIALLKLEKPADKEWYVSLYKTEDEIGKSATLAGYGATGTFNTGAKIGDMKKRAGSNTIDSIEKDMLITSVQTNDKQTALEFLIATGDSGGGLYIDGKLAGVHSCVMAVDKKADSDYGDEAGHTRVSQFIDWIEENTKN